MIRGSFIVTVTLTVLLSGCRIGKVPNDQYSKIWHTITLAMEGEEMNGRSVTVFGGQDSMVLKTWDYTYSRNDSTGVVTWTPINIRMEGVKIKTLETDSIYAWSKKLVRDFVLPTNFCDDYVGRLKVTIEYAGQVEQSCEYNSICRWDTLSSETVKLNRMINEKFGAL